MQNVLKSTWRRFMYAVISFGLVVPLISPRVHAAVTNPVPTAKVSFTFDDGLASATTQAAPTLAKYGLTGTDYVISGCVGMSTAPNTCRANPDALYMTWAQVQALQNTSGWEVGSHTVTHPCLASNTQPDCQANVLTQAQVAQELTQSKSDLAAHGVNATDFSTPYGDYTPAVLAQIAKVYASHRGFADQNVNGWPYNDLLLNDFPVQEGTTVAQVEAKIDQAIANNTWLVLTMHDIKVTPSTDPNDYEYSTAELDQIAAYVKAKQDAGLIKSVHVSDGLVKSDTNMLPNSSFNSGIGGGWTTDRPANVVADTGNNGSYPDSTNSIKFTASTSNVHLFSPKVAVNPTTTYLLKNFVNVANNNGGELAFFVDEYDSNGNWISGQYKSAERSNFVEDLNFTYKPSSLNVAQASLQTIVTANSGITAYFDNPQMFALSATQAPTNLVANGTFDAGISQGWTTDSATTIKADSANHGSPANPVNSVSMTATTANRHLFSPKVPVTTGKTYTISAYINITALTSNEIGFYMDEYDANNNWVSGKYITGVRAAGVSNPSFNSRPHPPRSKPPASKP